MHRNRQKYFSLKRILFYFWKTAKVSLGVCVCVALFEVIKRKYTPPLHKRNQKSYAFLVLFYFIIFLDVLQCPCLMLTHTFFSFHIILLCEWRSVTLHCIPIFEEISGKAAAATNGCSHLFFVCVFY